MKREKRKTARIAVEKAGRSAATAKAKAAESVEDATATAEGLAGIATVGKSNAEIAAAAEEKTVRIATNLV